MRIALVSCCKTKLTHRAKAKDLYISDLFKKVRMITDKTYDGWSILSALHGLLSPEEIIEPYEYTLIGKSKSEKIAWSNKVFNEINKQCNPEEDEFYIFAGEDYRKWLVPLLQHEGYKVHIPLKGLGIGQQKALLKKELSA